MSKSKKIEKLKQKERFTDDVKCYPKLLYKAFSCNHYFEKAGETSDGGIEYTCKKCPNGIIVNPKTHEVVNGKLRAKNNRKNSRR